MRTGKMGHRIEVFEKQLIDDGYGGDDVIWNSIGEIWCNVEVEGGVEEYNNDKVTWISKYIIECRAWTYIDWSTDKICNYEGILLFIRGMADVKQQGNRFYVKGRRGNPSDFNFAIDTGVFSQNGSEAFDQLGRPIFNQSGI